MRMSNVRFETWTFRKSLSSLERLLILFVRKLFYSLFAIFLSACGFEPLYGPSSSNTPVVCNELDQVKILRIKDREGQILRNHLVDLMNPKGQPTFPTAFLAVNLVIGKEGLAILIDGTSSRYKLIFTAQLQLKDAETEKILYTDTVKVVNAYYIGALTAVSAYATTFSERDAREKGLKLLADQIKVMIASYYKQKLIAGNENPKTT